ncbi:MAG: PQQ-binding-like beta-propeller repeat protein [Sphingobacteriaceae bacterium]
MFKTLLFPAIIILSNTCNNVHHSGYNTWETFNGDKTNSHYSSLKQIDTGNVHKLQVAWTYHTGDADPSGGSQIQTNPIIVGKTLYGVSAQLKLFALDAVSGKQRWIYDPVTNSEGYKVGISANRGVTYWKEGADERIFLGAGSYLFAINALTGKPITSFGKNGAIDLRDDLDRDTKDLYVAATTPGIIFKNLLIMGSRLSEEGDGAPGHIRAFDVRTGKRTWIFHTLPYPGELGYDTWENKDAWKYTSGVNCWAGFALDEKRGIVYAPTGSATNDFYGGLRKGKNLFANCLIAINAATGKRIWHFQTIHHDMWDRDLPSAPNLLTVTHKGKKIDAVSVSTKTGYVFIFDRETGEPLFPVEEKSVPSHSDLEGESPWPTQPSPALPAPFVKQQLKADELNNLVPEPSQKIIREQFSLMNSEHMFTPPGFQKSLIYPGYDGGAEWGGSAVDPETAYLYVNANQVPWTMQMKLAGDNTSRKNLTWNDLGMKVYISYCASCHGESLKGSANVPSLLELNKKYKPAQVQEIVQNGRRMMPSFKQLTDVERDAILSFVMELPNGNNPAPKQESKEVKSVSRNYPALPYSFMGYNKFQTPEGYPASNPPWGTLTAINMNTGKTAWQIPFGEYPEFSKKGIITGTENYGGGVVTAGGLFFIAATRDGKCRVFNKTNGRLLWETQLPAPGFATPATYAIDGKQYFIIACGGGKLGTKSGDAYIAFALPD